MTPLHILLVEDEPQTAQMVRFYLEREGFAVSRVCGGPAGETAFRAGQSHLVILDSMLPGFDGLELCRRIRQTSTLPVLMLTTRAEDTDKVIGTGIGAADYVTNLFSTWESLALRSGDLRPRSMGYRFNGQPTAQ
jgi:DNA-binding response OmpR family regulator